MKEWIMKITLLVSIFLFFLLSLCTALENEDPPWVYRGRGEKYYMKGEVGKAIVEYKKALAARTRENTEGIYPEVNLRLSEIYLSEGLYDLAIIHVTRAEQYKDELEIPETIYDVLYTKAEILKKLKRYNETIALYESIIKEDENWKFYSRQNPYKLFEETVADPELQKKFGRAYLELGRLKFLSKNYDNAIPYLKMALMYRYKNKESLNLLIDCFLSLDNRNLAEKAKSLYSSNS
jgi:tetratricopeptide (TPR) repeat protein